jgi:hypothetical protein
MRAWGRISIAVWIAMPAVGCSMIPQTPPDFALPMREILMHTSCELQAALRRLASRKSDRFKAREWIIRVSLKPRTEADITPGVGFTRNAPNALKIMNPVRLTKWIFGGGPGIQLDLRGTRDSSVDFAFDSSELIDDKHLACNIDTPTFHALAQHLGIGDWLYRSVDAMDVAGSGSIDKPSYNSEIFIKFGGNGSYTYTFPPGIDLGTLAGYYQVDEQLNITFTAKPKVAHFHVVTLPKGGKGFRPNRAPALVYSAAAIESTAARADLSQIEQAIRNLQSRP